MSFHINSSRIRSNSEQYSFKSSGLRRALLVDSEFDSTKLKLDILGKFERSTLAQRPMQVKMLLSELSYENALLQQIKRLASKRQNQPYQKRQSQNIQESQSVLRKDLEQIQQQNVDHVDNIATQLDKKDLHKLSTLGDYFRQVRHKGKCKTYTKNTSFARNSCFSQDSSEQPNTAQRVTSKFLDKTNLPKTQQFSGNNILRSESYLRQKEKELLQKQINILQLQKKLVQVDKLKKTEQQQFLSISKTHQEVINELLSSLRSGNITLSEQQQAIIHKLSNLQQGIQDSFN